jgi:hypothetical protein
MSHDLICDWLGLPAGSWPPDHYTLLGIESGRSDDILVEQRVRERMEQVRRYQLKHPEAATEAMNRLAQALVCLTDQEAKKSYDANLFKGPSLADAAGQKPAGAATTTDPFAWLFQEPPRHQVPGRAGFPLGISEAALSLQDLPPLVSVPARGPGLQPSLHQRLLSVRRIFHAWQAVGKYLENVQREFYPREEVSNLQYQLQIIRAQLGTWFPAMVEIGQPGHLVLSLARQQIIAPTLQALLPDQRERLGHDWKVGSELIRERRRELREELRGRSRSRRRLRKLRLVWARLSENPEDILLFLAMIALDIAYPPLRAWWYYQALALGGLIVMRFLWGKG